MSLVFGVGVNDSEFLDNSRDKKIYMSTWLRMLQRCYSDAYHRLFPTYKLCEVCEEWQTYSSFKTWMSSQDWKGKSLDKDLLVEGNKIYSPETCVFIESKINSIITERKNNSSGLPQGVTLRKSDNKFIASISLKGKIKQLGVYPTKNEASGEYLKAKSNKLTALSANYQEPVFSALRRIAKSCLVRSESLLCNDPPTNE